MKLCSALNAVLVILGLFQSSAQAGLIPLTTTWQPAPNRAPPYYIWQNDPGLTEYLNSNGVSALCVPAAISNALLYQYAFKATPASQLKIPGLSTDATTGQPVVDSNTMVRYFAKACGFQLQIGTGVSDGANCVAQFYRESGYTQAKVRMIRQNVSGLNSGVELEDRSPTLDDIRIALDQGYEIIASVVMMKQEGKRWTKVSSHSFNVYGLTNEGIISSNPTRAYRVNFVDPVFDVVTHTQATSFPENYSSIEIFGRTLERPNAHTFLAGLTLIKPE